MNEIIKMGINFSLDDLGTGYSSLNHLKLLPISSLKMDKAFVQNIKGNSKEEFIADAIIDLARKLNLNIVAEGVGNSEQLQFLKARNCNIIQGFFFSKPLCVLDMEELIKNGLKFEI
jgi:polar amino acid transport system substrate-binding protein